MTTITKSCALQILTVLHRIEGKKIIVRFSLCHPSKYLFYSNPHFLVSFFFYFFGLVGFLKIDKECL